MKRVFCLGNGESRKGVNLDILKQHGKIYGCNALYRDYTPDVLVAVDQGIIHEIYQSGYAHKNVCYFRNWHSHDAKNYNLTVYGTDDEKVINFIESLNLKKENERGNSNRFVLGGTSLISMAKSVMKDKSKLDEYKKSFQTYISWLTKDKVQHIKEIQGGQDLGWAAGPTAIWLAIKKEQPQQVYLLGHDLNSKNHLINNLYKGTKNYSPVNHKETPSQNWIIQLNALIGENPDIAFYKVNRESIDNNCKVNRIQPQFHGHKNLVYITYDDLQNSIDKRW
tara:strand:+ start:11513 stop:12352 length:840 start_codon:yes stop_codon:yes gene_type:complete